MRELGRILSRRRFLLVLALILVLNGALFLWEQREADYGMDLELPARSVVYYDGFNGAALDPERPEPRAVYRLYLKLVEQAGDMEARAAMETIAAQRDALAEKIRAGTAGDGDKAECAAAGSVLKRLEYLTGYGEWLENIDRNKENLLTFSIFNDPDSFSGRNILKTAGEFEKLRGVELRLGADGAVESVLRAPISDYLLTLGLLLTALSFLEERRAGLWSVVRASPGGRLGLGLRRAGILLAASVLLTAAIYGTDLTLAVTIYGDPGFGRAAQSVEALGRLPELWTVGGFLGRFFLLRAASAYLVALILWLLLSAVNNVKYTVIVSAAALAAEYSLYALLPVQSVFNVLKYFNIFTYISLPDLYTNYLNIDIFGFPLGIRAISQWALAPLIPLAAAGCAAVQCLKKPAGGRDLLGRAAMRINGVTDSFLRRLGLFGMELHKTIWLQKGVVVAAALVWVSGGLEYAAPVPVVSPAQSAALQYTRELSGPLTDETFERMDGIAAGLEDVLTARDEAQAAFDAGKIDYPELDLRLREAQAAQTNKEGLDAVRERAQALRELGENAGFTPWLLDETPFESVYGQRARANQDRAAALAVLALALMLSGSVAFERRSGMTALLRSVPGGREALALRKLLVAAAASVFVWGTVYGREFYALISQYAPDCWAAPVRSLAALSDFPLPLTVAGALAALYGLRLTVLLSAAAMALFISGLSRRPETAGVGCAAALLLPSLLCVYVGIRVFRPLAILLPLELTPLLLPRSGAPAAAAAGVGAAAALGALSCAALLASARSFPGGRK